MITDIYIIYEGNFIWTVQTNQNPNLTSFSAKSISEMEERVRIFLSSFKGSYRFNIKEVRGV